MLVSDIIKAKLLFVDDDQSFLDFVKQTFGELSRNQWELTCVTDAAQALAALRREPVDLAMLDLKMPGVDGLQLLRMLKREFPTLQMAFLSGQADEQSRRVGLEEGAALFLEKPASLAGMESLFATINELARWQHRMGGRSVVRRAGLLDIVKMECKSGNSRLFEVFGAEERGQIWIKEGVIVHALAPDKRGQSAFAHLVCLTDAEFHLKPFAEPIERSITREWEFIVLEAARVQEQLLKSPVAPEVEPPPVPKVSAPTPSKPAPPAVETSLRMAPAETRKATAPEKPAEEFTPGKLPAPPAQPRAPEAPAVSAPAPAPRAQVFPPVAFAPATRLTAVAADPAGLQIEELLVCSDRREVFYEWQCAEMQKRLGLIEFVGTKARQMSQGLPLGKFDRLELQAAAGRIVIQLHSHRNVLVRSNTKSRPTPAADAHATKTIVEWLAQQTPAKGVLACGVILTDRKTLHQSFSADLQLTALNGAWPCVADTFDAATRMQFPAWQLRWIFERAQLYGVRRVDGVSFGLLLSKDAQAVDLAAVEQLFEEFKSLRTA
ncbi:MAG: response regulator [Pedosphaera sp.]|nr:response regulator [Pedosphaera sp.]